MTGRAGRSRRRRGIDVLLLVAVVAVLAVPPALWANTAGRPEGEAYAGTDATAVAVVEALDPDYRPWFSPLFEPSSGEVESGLFALQAALGAGLLGFVAGRLSGRRRREPEPGPPAPPAP